MANFYSQLTCKECGETKARQMFYTSNKGKCKECVKRRVRANRAANIEYYKEFDRRRANNPDRVAARAAYAKSEAGLKNSQKAKNAWAIRNKHKRKAHIKTGNAIRDGKLTKQPCEVCGTTEGIEAHHDDYSKLLDTRWLCTKHHAKHHKNEREQVRQAS